MHAIEKIIKAKLKYKQLVHELSSTLRKNEISYSELEVLYTIGKYKEVQPSKIAEDLFQERASISRILKDLHNRNLIKYIHSKQDRRKVTISLSKEGTQVLRKTA